MKNKVRLLNVLIFILLLTLPAQAFADEKGDPHGHGNEKKETDQNQTDQKPTDIQGPGEEGTEDHGHEGEEGHSGDGHEDDGHVDDDQGGEGNEDDGHGDDGHGDDGHEDEGHEENFEEIGPNYPVLGAFAAINGGFLLFGAIRKVSSNRRKKGV